MTEDKSIGYTKEEYYKISSKNELPKRCPILRKCCRAVLTRYKIGHDSGGSDMTFDEFLQSQGQSWDMDKMIKEIEMPSWKYAHDVLTSVENVCPEVTLFEPEYMPNKFIQSAYGSGSYYKESHSFEAEAMHYSECAEFSEYIFQSSKEKFKELDTKKVLNQIPEKHLEDYLANNIEALEPGLKFIERQKSIGKWSADIFASDIQGNDVLIELKSKNLNRDEIHMLTGQVSKYFNGLKKKAHNLRLIIVLPKSNKDRFDDLYQGLHHWVEQNKVTLFQFDYFLYDKKFMFSKIRAKQ